MEAEEKRTRCFQPIEVTAPSHCRLARPDRLERSSPVCTGALLELGTQRSVRRRKSPSVFLACYRYTRDPLGGPPRNRTWTSPLREEVTASITADVRKVRVRRTVVDGVFLGRK